MAKDGVSDEVYQGVLSVVETGVHRAKDIEISMSGVTGRQVRRALNRGVEEGSLHKPERGVYYLASQNLVPFYEYQKLCVSKVCMSESNKQYKTYDTDVDLLRDREHLKTLNDKDNRHQIERDIRTSEFRTSDLIRTSARTVEEFVELVLIEVGFKKYSQDQFNRCVGKLKDASWEVIDETNLHEFLDDCLERFSERVDAYKAEKSNITNPVVYFFGIVRRALQQWVLEAKRQYVTALRAGDAEVLDVVEVSVPVEQTVGVQEFVSSYAEAACGVERGKESTFVTGATQSPSEGRIEAQEQLSGPWEDLSWDMQLMCVQKGSFPVSDDTVKMAVRYLKNSGIKLEHAKQGLWYLKDHDDVGANYICNNLTNHERVLDSIVRHYQRYLKETSSVTKAASTEKTKKQQDERYANFYALFPDA